MKNMLKLQVLNRYTSLVLFTLVCMSAAYGQTYFDQYKPLESAGKLPAAITNKSAEVYEQAAKKIENSKEKDKKKKRLKQFALNDQFAIDEVMRSGQILFGDTVSLYLKEVVKQLPAGIDKNVDIYVMRTPIVNAFAMDRGTIFVSLGLLARVENEAQLAFILAHELAHIKHKHNVQLFLKTEEHEKTASKSTASRSKRNRALIERNNFSKEHELEADEKGFAVFEKSGYSYETVAHIFELLKYADQPFTEVPLKRSLFESDGFTLPNLAWLDSVATVQGIKDDEDDSESTHPNLKKRRAAYDALLAKVADKSGKDFLVSESYFQLARNIARFELSRAYLHNGQLSPAIYNSYALLQQFPDNPYLKKCIGQALYINAKFESDGGFSRIKAWKEAEGNIQSVYYLLDTLTNREATVLAAQYLWNLRKEQPNDADIKRLSEDILIELGAHVNGLDEFKLTTIEDQTKPATLPNEQVEKQAEKPAKKKASSEKPLTYKERKKLKEAEEKKQKEAQEERNELNHWRNAFQAWKTDTTFVQAFEKGQKQYARRKARRESFNAEDYWAEINKRDEKGLMLGVKKVLILNPIYRYANEDKGEEHSLLATERKRLHMLDIMQQMRKKTGLDAQVIDVKEFSENEIGKFNEMRYLSDWYDEQSDYEDLPVTYGMDQERVNEIAKKYGTDQLLLTGVLSSKGSNKNDVLLAVGGTLLLGPFGLVYLPAALKPNYESIFFAMLVDLNDGTYHVIKYDRMDIRDSDAQLKQQYYDVFNQIKTKKKN